MRCQDGSKRPHKASAFDTSYVFPLKTPHRVLWLQKLFRISHLQTVITAKIWLTSFATAWRDRTSGRALLISAKWIGEVTICCLMPGVKISKACPCAYCWCQCCAPPGKFDAYTFAYTLSMTSAPRNRYS